MSNYELTAVYSAKLSEVKQKKQLKELADLIAKQKGRVVSKDDWGKKPLAYLIGKQTDGYYVNWVVQLPLQAPQAVSKELELNEDLLRFLLVKVNERGEGSKRNKRSIKSRKKS